MKRTFSLLLEGKKCTLWNLAEDSAEQLHFKNDSLNPAEIAATVSSLLVEEGYKGDALCLVIGSFDCFSVTQSVMSGRKSQSYKELLYQIEGDLPISAETIAADRLSTNSSMVVAVNIEWIKPFLDSAEELGTVVTLISPSALLATKMLLRESPLELGIVVWIEGDASDVIGIEKGKPSVWRISGADSASLVVTLSDLVEGISPKRIVLCGPENTERDKTIQSYFLDSILETHSLQKTQIAMNAGAQSVSGKDVPWINLRCGLLASKRSLLPIQGWLKLAVCLTLVATVVFCGTCLWKAREYHDLSRKYLADQTKSYRELYPSGAVPAAIRTRFESDYRGLLGQIGQDAEYPAIGSASMVLCSLLKAIPTDLRFQISEIRIEGSSLYLVGEVREHGDADALAENLKLQGILPDRPRTERRDEKAVSFWINASAKSDSKNQEEKSR